MKEYVYIVEAGGFFKIGYTKKKNISSRISELQVGCPFRINLFIVLFSADGRSLESELHRIFKSKRLNGEWFNLSHEDISIIKTEYSHRIHEVHDVAYTEPSLDTTIPILRQKISELELINRKKSEFIQSIRERVHGKHTDEYRTFKAGKYKGVSMYFVSVIDPDYCNWFIDQKDFNYHVRKRLSDMMDHADGII